MTLRIAREALAANSALLLGMGAADAGRRPARHVLGVRATLEGFSTFVTGIVMTGYYVGYIAGSLAAPASCGSVGHIRVFAALTATAAAAILVQSLFVGPLEWTLLRAISGVCFAGIYVVAESWLNDRADRSSRGTLLASYMIVIYVGIGAGQFFLNTADPRGDELFVLIGVLISRGRRADGVDGAARARVRFAAPRDVSARCSRSRRSARWARLLGLRDGYVLRGRARLCRAQRP